MSERVFISWTMVNWITVVLMVALGYMLLGLIAQFYQNWKAPTAGAGTA